MNRSTTKNSPRTESDSSVKLTNNVVDALARIYDLGNEAVLQASSTLKKNGKEFCVGLLENPDNHAWWGKIRNRPEKVRYSVAGSLFLLRKVLPSPPDSQQFRKHATLMSTPAPPVDPRFSWFVTREIDRLFPVGWDDNYASYCERYIPTGSACLERAKTKGGAKSFLREHLGPEGLLNAQLTGSFCPDSYPVKYQVVPTGGKDRGVTIASAMSHILGPLHRMIYDRLSRQHWLLRGEATPARFSSFREKNGEVFVSGDYESATDNLNLDVSEFVLQCILDKAVSLPSGIKSYALKSLRATIHYQNGLTVEQKRGQLMGNFLSFPLLCLTNYLTFKFIIPRRVPIKINGDDIVFRCRPDEWERWAERVGSLGLTLSRGKTLVSKRVFSLNSSFFRVAGKRAPRGIPVIRASMLRSLEGLPPTPESYRKFTRGWGGEAGRIVGALYLRAHGATIRATSRSVEALGIRAHNGVITAAGFGRWEAFHRLTKVARDAGMREVPLPSIKLKGGVTGTPPGWTQVPQVLVRGALREGTVDGETVACWEDQYRSESRAWSWSRDFHPLHQDWWKEAKLGAGPSYRYHRATCRRLARCLRALGSRNGNIRFVLRPPMFSRYQPRVWVPEDVFKTDSNLFGVGLCR